MKETKNLTYRVFVEKEKYQDGSAVYVTQVPTLGISDFGSSIEEALNNTQKLIKFHIESLIEEGEPIPSPDDANNIIITNSEVSISSNRKLVLA